MTLCYCHTDRVHGIARVRRGCGSGSLAGYKFSTKMRPVWGELLGNSSWRYGCCARGRGSAVAGLHRSCNDCQPAKQPARDLHGAVLMISDRITNRYQCFCHGGVRVSYLSRQLQQSALSHLHATSAALRTFAAPSLRCGPPAEVITYPLLHAAAGGDDAGGGHCRWNRP